MNKIRRVAIIDDSEPDKIFLSILLNDAGYNGIIEVYDTAELARDKMLQNDYIVPDVIFLDGDMPGMSGMDFAETVLPKIRYSERIYVAMLSSSALPEDITRAQSIAAIHSYWTKPLSGLRVLNLLRLAEQHAGTVDMAHRSIVAADERAPRLRRVV